MAVRKFLITKDNTSYRHLESGDKRGAGKERHWLVGRPPQSQRLHHTNAQITFDWHDVVTVNRATLVLTGDNVHVNVGSEGKFHIRRIKETASWSEGDAVGQPPPDDHWETSEYEVPACYESTTWHSTTVAVGVGETRLDVLSLIRFWAPTWVKFRIGTGAPVPGKYDTSKPSNNKGFRMYGDDEPDHVCEFASSDHPTEGWRPYVEIDYDPPNKPPFANPMRPKADDPITELYEDDQFEVGFSDPDVRDTFDEVQIQVRRKGAAENVYVWNPGKRKTTTQEREDAKSVDKIPLDQFTVGPTYEWRARVWDQHTQASNWSGWVEWKLRGNAPTITTVHPLGTQGTLAGVHFIADWNHPDTKQIQSIQIQLRENTPVGSPLWEAGDNAWDTGAVTPTSVEQSSHQVDREYRGDSLDAGTYSWRVKVTDRLGVDSPWAYDTPTPPPAGPGGLTLTQNYDVDPELYAETAGYERRLHAYRIVLRDIRDSNGNFTVNRKPGRITAVIEDAANVGASAYVNAPGELYFTLPATHWQVSACEPYQTHYAVEQYVGGSWKERFFGLITDFDASGDDIVVYGTDYLGLLSLDVERRNSPGTGTKSVEKGGAKYGTKQGTSRKWRVSEIIVDQLNHAKSVVDSPTGFIGVGRVDLLSEEVTINASFRQRLDFINGLIDSAKAGTGKRTRLSVRRSRAAEGPAYEWTLIQNAGRFRPELRMEYGGLVQGFRVVAMGDFAVRALGIGRRTNELKPMYASQTATQMPTTVWGNIAKVGVWQDIEDINDLQRRVKQMASESSRVGKRIALGLRTHALSPFDGWDLCDYFPLDLQRGVVHTDRYGSGRWVIWGTEWRLFPDGHEELTLVIRPLEDDQPADPDLIPSHPYVETKEWSFGVGPPRIGETGVSLLLAEGELDPDALTTYYLDQSTGYVWQLNDEGDAYTLVGNTWGDTLTPSGPQGMSVIAGYKMVGVTWLRPGEGDLDHFEVRYTSDLADPDSWTVVSTHGTGVIIGDLEIEPTTEYWFQVRAVDRLGFTQTSEFDLTPVDANENEHAGWCPALNATPTKVPQEDLVVHGLMADIIDTDQITADAIFGGTLTVGQAGLGAEIEVFNSSGVLIGVWNANGLVIVDPQQPKRAIWLSAGNMKVTTGLLWAGDPSRPDPVGTPASAWTQSVTAEGINATSITVGKAPGGNNAIPNSGFELVPFSTLLSKVWTSAADWGTGTSQVGADPTGTELKLTSAAY